MIGLILVSLLSLWAQEVVIQGNQTSDLEYERHLNNNPHKQSYIEYQRRQDIEKKEHLLSHLKKAQFQFLQGSLAKAVMAFKKMVDMQHEADWGLEERKAIHYAFLRLAQLEKSENRKHDWLHQAYVFDPERKPDTQLFPPPLVNQLEKIKKTSRNGVVSLPQKAERFSQILVNGKSHPGGTSFIKHPKGEIRITFLSNQLSTQTLTSQVDQLEDLELAQVPLSSGDCHNIKLNQDIDGAASFKVFASRCQTPVQSTAPSLKMPPIAKIEAKKTEPRFYQSKWFWIGTSVVIAGLTWHQLNQNQSASPPAGQAVKTYEFSNQ